MLNRALLMIVLAVAAAQPLRADVLATNLGPGDGFSPNATQFGIIQAPAVQLRLAIRFTAPAGRTHFAISRIGLPIGLVGSGGPVTIQIALAADEADLPGQVIEQLSMVVHDGSSLAIADSVQGSLLQPGTRYWIVVPAGIPANTFYWQFGFGATVPYSFQMSANGVQGAWQLPGNAYFGYKVEGEAALGACCNLTIPGSCAVLSAEVCQSLGLHFRGYGTACSAIPCPVPLPNGACCTGAGCTVTSVVFCSGPFLGPGSVCEPAARGGPINPCCRADFNASGTLSVQDLFDFLNAYFSGCP